MIDRTPPILLALFVMVTLMYSLWSHRQVEKEAIKCEVAVAAASARLDTLQEICSYVQPMSQGASK